jgi:uncharacterized protein with von Willebrand factor type A (vWA) domain
VRALGEPPPRATREIRGPDAPFGGVDAPKQAAAVDRASTYSAREALRAKDFAAMSDAELDEARALLKQMRWDPGRRRTRRWTPARRGDPDLRRAIRDTLRSGGEILAIPRRGRKEKPRTLVLLCDVSGSMERYSRMLLSFVYALARTHDRVEAFLFATRLTRITPLLSGRGLDRVVSDVAREVPDWAGGTRIGETLDTFNRRWARRVLGRGAVVLLISDGWDRGDPALLATTMARLRRSCHRVIWLNPRLGSPSYQPLTRGMQAALPYVDDHLPVHDLASLASLADRLTALPPRRGQSPFYVFRKMGTVPFSTN